MIAFFDGNTVWRRKFADALRRRSDKVTIVCPTTRMALGNSSDKVLRPLVPAGWASTLAAVTMPYLNWVAERHAAREGDSLRALFVTTPHYLRLARRAYGRIPCYYYCSDDYLGYEGWPVEATRANEGELCAHATATIFVSEALRDRAISNYGIAPEKTFVSANATDLDFADPNPVVPEQLASLSRPIFGVAGMMTGRIDYDFLLELAEQTSGSLALVGPFDSEVDSWPSVQRLRAHPRVHCFGWQAHETIRGWMSGFDVAVIPYRESEFNRLCSPMRLFDHLAIGRPILATPACDQIRHYQEVVVAGSQPLADTIAIVLERAAVPQQSHVETWDNRVGALLNDPIAASLAPLF